MTLEEVQQWITTTWIRCQDEVWRQLPTPKKVSKDDQEPVAWMHNVIEGNVITHMPADIGRHPERWTALYKDPTPCKTCESLAMAVMNDQTYHEKVIPKREWVGLTDEEVSEIIDREIGFNSCWGPEEKFARAIEQALKEKNT
jgi:hypothetical protein